MAIQYTPEQQAAINAFSKSQPIVYNEWLNGGMWNTSTGTKTYVPFADYVMKKSQLDITTPTPTPVSPVEQARRIAEANRQAQARLLQVDPKTNQTEDVAGNAARNALMNKVQAETAKIQNPSLQTPSVSSSTSPVGADGQPRAPITAKEILQTNKEADNQGAIKQQALQPGATPQTQQAAVNITNTQQKLNALPSIGTPVGTPAPVINMKVPGTTTPTSPAAPKAPNINITAKPVDYTQTGQTSQNTNDLMRKAALEKKVTAKAGTYTEPAQTDLGPAHTQFKGATDVSNILANKNVLQNTQQANPFTADESPVSSKQYDLLRQQIQADQARTNQSQMEQLKQQLVSRGLGQGTAFGEKSLMKAQIEANRTQANRLGQVDVAQAQAEEARRAQQEQNRFQASESDLDRLLQRDVEQGRLSQADKELALNATQFSDKMSFDAWAKDQDYTEEERSRAWQGAQNANQRAFQASERQASQQGEFEQQTTEREASQAFQTATQSMLNDFQTNRMRLQDQIDDKNKIEQIMSDAAFKKGANNALTADEIAKLTPLEQAAYSAGSQGKTYEDYQTSRDADISYRNALIAQIDPDDPYFKEQLKEIFYGISFVKPATVGSTSSSGSSSGTTDIGRGGDFVGMGG